MGLDIGKALKEGLTVLRDNPVIFVPALIGAVISSLLNFYQTTFLDSMFGSEYFTGVAAGEIVLRVMEFMLAYTPLLLVSFVIFLFLNGVCIRMVYDGRKGKASLKGAAQLVASKYVTLFVGTVIYGVVLIIGLIARVIPGIYIGIKWVFYEYAILFEKDGARSSLRRSWEMTKGNWWALFALMLIFGIIIWGFALIIPEIASNFFIVLLTMTWFNAMLTDAYLQLKEGK